MFYRSFSSIYASIAVVVFMQTIPFFLRASWIDFVKSINSSRIQWKNTGSGSKLFGEIFMKKNKNKHFIWKICKMMNSKRPSPIRLYSLPFNTLILTHLHFLIGVHINECCEAVPIAISWFVTHTITLTLDASVFTRFPVSFFCFHSMKRERKTFFSRNFKLIT